MAVTDVTGKSAKFAAAKVAQENKLIIHQELRAKRNAMKDVPIIQKRGMK